MSKICGTRVMIVYLKGYFQVREGNLDGMFYCSVQGDDQALMLYNLTYVF